MIDNNTENLLSERENQFKCEILSGDPIIRPSKFLHTQFADLVKGICTVNINTNVICLQSNFLSSGVNA